MSQLLTPRSDLAEPLMDGRHFQRSLFDRLHAAVPESNLPNPARRCGDNQPGMMTIWAISCGSTASLHTDSSLTL